MSQQICDIISTIVDHLITKKYQAMPIFLRFFFKILKQEIDKKYPEIGGTKAVSHFIANNWIT